MIVTDTNDGVLLVDDNGHKYSVPKDNSNRDYRAIIASGVSIQPVQSDTVGQIKAVAQKRIIDIVIPPPADQSGWMIKELNLTAKFSELLHAALVYGGIDNLTQENQDALSALLALWAKIKAIRQHSDAIEADFNNGESVDPIDGTSQTHPGGWPR